MRLSAGAGASLKTKIRVINVCIEIKSSLENQGVEDIGIPIEAMKDATIPADGAIGRRDGLTPVEKPCTETLS